MSGFFILSDAGFHGILLLLCADCKDFFSTQQIFLFLAFPPKPFVAVEPFYIFQLGVLVELIEEAVTEASGCENGNRKGDVCPFGYCSPDCAIDKIVDAVHSGVRHCVQFLITPVDGFVGCFIGCRLCDSLYLLIADCRGCSLKYRLLRQNIGI